MSSAETEGPKELVDRFYNQGELERLIETHKVTALRAECSQKEADKLGREAAQRYLKFRKIMTLNGQGFVSLVSVMDNEEAIVQAARVSYGEGTKTPSNDRTLIRYLMRHRHTTPLEMVELKFLIYCPMDLWRQWIRHRTANVNEYSTRYSKAIDDMVTTPPDKWRLQSETNKQGSNGILEHWPGESTTGGGHMCNHHTIPGYKTITELEHGQTPGEYLSAREVQFHEDAKKIYQERLALGVAREQARKDLPLSNFTKAYWKCDLHNILHFLGLRMDSHAQAEIREYACAIGEKIIAPLFPNVWEAFLDYRLDSLTLSGPEVQAIKSLTDGMDLSFYRPKLEGWDKREATEFTAKLEKLGM